MLKDFKQVDAIPQDVIKKYKDRVPEELLQIWQGDGLGTFLDGYLKVINPDEYIDLVEKTYYRGDVSLPIFVTAFGDLIVLENNKRLRVIKYKDGIFNLVTGSLKNFIKFIDDGYIKEKYFEMSLYYDAVSKYGVLNYNQCFGFVPLLILGGFKDVEHLEKVKIYEHLWC